MPGSAALRLRRLLKLSCVVAIPTPGASQSVTKWRCSSSACLGLGLSGLVIDVIRLKLEPGADAPRWPFGDTRVFDKLQRLSFRFFERNASASIITARQAVHQALMAMAGTERVFGLLDTEPDWSDAPAAGELPALVGGVQFRDVNSPCRTWFSCSTTAASWRAEIIGSC